jgi:hypothetical protein
MKTITKYKGVISIITIAIIVLVTACKEEITGPETVPIRAEIKQVIVNNSIYVEEIKDADKTDDLDTVIGTSTRYYRSYESGVLYSYLQH